MTQPSDIRIASIGDFCVDYYTYSSERYLGGTGYNVAVQANAAGAKTSVISVVGTDEYGDRFLSQLHSLNINTEHLRQITGSTSRLMVRLDAQKRPDFYDWDLGVLSQFDLTPDDQAFLMQHDAVHNVLYLGLERQFEQFCQFELPGTLKVADFAGGSQYSPGTDAILRYASQLDVIMRSIQNDEELTLLQRMSEEYDVIAIGTLGKAGSIAFHGGQRFSQPTATVNPVDTTGAGDTYIANFVVSFLRTGDIQQAMGAATSAAVQVIQGVGATPQPRSETE